MPNEIFILSVMSRLKDPIDVKWRDEGTFGASSKETHAVLSPESFV